MVMLFDSVMDHNELANGTERQRRAPNPRERDSKRLSSASSRNILRLLLHEDRESQDLQRLLHHATEQLKLERQRADDAEHRAKDVLSRMIKVNDARLLALQDASKANEELRLYKLQLDRAQKEINRAQEVLVVLEGERNAAEEEAAKSRSTVRKLMLEKDVARAREEGRREGLREGLERGKELGYVQGRATGYAHARGRAIRNVAFDDDVGDDDPRLALREDSLPERPPSAPVIPPDLPIDPPAPPPPIVPQESQPATYVRPTPIRELSSSTHHPTVEIPPDGWIPEAGSDSVIRLPPPHDMSRLPPSPHQSPAPAPSPPLPPLPPSVPEEEPTLMIPPLIQRPESAASLARSSTSTPHKHRSRRHSSSASSSTTISQLDMLTAPANSTLRALSGTPLSVIQEVLSTQTSPNPTREGSIRSSRQGSVMQVKTPTPRSAATHLSNLENSARQREKSRRRSFSSTDSSDSSDSTIRSPIGSHTFNDRRASSSSNSTHISINIEPPSRPHSNSSMNVDAAGHFSDFLSPADANRPVPLPPDRSKDLPQPLPQSSGDPVPIVLPDNQLPPGFVPMGSFTPSPAPIPALPIVPPVPSLSPINAFGGDVLLPGKFGPAPNTNGNSGLAGQTTAANGTRSSRKGKRSDVAKRLGPADSDDDEVSSSISSDRETLTTPTSRRLQLGSPYAVSPAPDPDEPPVIPRQVEPPLPTKTPAPKNNKRRGKGKR